MDNYSKTKHENMPLFEINERIKAQERTISAYKNNESSFHKFLVKVSTGYLKELLKIKEQKV